MSLSLNATNVCVVKTEFQVTHAPPPCLMFLFFILCWTDVLIRIETQKHTAGLKPATALCEV